MNENPTVLLTPVGQELLGRLAGEPAGAGPQFALGARLRREYPAGLVAAAMAQHELRLAARAKFGRAMQMLFTRDACEQSSAELIARHRAARLAGARRVADLCCGIGGDLIALAGAGPRPAGETREVLAVDRDEAHARLAVHNAGVYGVAGGVRACVADVRDVSLAGVGAVFIDPARRVSARGRGGEGGAPGAPGYARVRRFRAGVSEPPLDWCFALAGRVPAVCVKAAPGLPLDLVPPGWEAEFIADGRDLKEAVLWSPALAAPAPASGSPGVPGSRSGPRRATILPGGHTLCSAGFPPSGGPDGGGAAPAVPVPPVPVGPPGEFLLDPNPAVTRAGLVRELALQAGAWQIDPLIAFLATDRKVSTPFARTLRVVESAPWHEKRFAARLRELGVGAADLRRRGLAGDVDQIRRRLRLSGPHRATIVLTRVNDKPWGLICADPDSPLALAG